MVPVALRQAARPSSVAILRKVDIQRAKELTMAPVCSIPRLNGAGPEREIRKWIERQGRQVSDVHRGERLIPLRCVLGERWNEDR